MKITTPCVSSGSCGGQPWGGLYLGAHAHMHTCTCARPPPHSRPRLCPRGTGSLWDPSITVETLEAHQLRLSFTPWNESTKYQILLDSFLPTENRSCARRVMDLTVVTAPSAALLTLQLGSETPLQASRPRQIGRASCRERVSSPV